MITKIHGKLLRLESDYCVLNIEPFEYQVLIPEFTRRQLQMKTGEDVSLRTLHYLEGNPAQGGRLTPRLVGFTSEVEREFFELFCSVDGVGAKKALRAMVRPVQDVARAIEEQDVNTLKTLPGIGPATAERIIAKLRRKMAKFALLIPADGNSPASDVERSIVDEVYQILVTLGWSEADARNMLETAVQDKKKYKDVDDLLQVVWEKQGSA